MGISSFFDSCSTTCIEVLKFNAEKAQRPNAVVYYLPQTVLDFDFAVARSYYTPGPYASYSEKFLGITKVMTAPMQNCQIVGVRLATHQEVDLQYPFLALLHRRPNTSLFLQLTENGFLLPAEASHQDFAKVQRISTEQPPYTYTDLSSSPFIDSEKNVFHSLVQKDTSFVSVPVMREVSVKRSSEEKARQAADQIFALRKRRMDLLLGDDMPTTSDGIPTVLKEIARLEAEYLSLFIGRTDYDTIHCQLTYIPNQTDNSAILCRFSSTQGIVPASNMAASPLLLQLDCETKEMIKTDLLPVLRNAYYYRTITPAHLQLSLDGKSIYQERVAISQYGKLMHAPIQLRLTNVK